MCGADSSTEGTLDPWYAEGLRFTCQKCGGCCTGAPGFVWVTDEEMERIAGFLKMSVPDSRRRFCRNVWGRVSLRERPSYDCVFLTAQGCRIYPVRPRQCRSFPFWGKFLKARWRWESLASRCPGVGTGRLYSLCEIQRILEGERAT